ncbi:MAG: VWA domain-containing protein [Armatimonadota bacterium]|nr:VWA domain-containing protein [Armatimonadota bacterium]
MELQSPQMLWLSLLLLPLAGGYWWALRTQGRAAVLHTQVPLLTLAMQQRRGLRRHLPAATFLMSLLAVLFALARPVAPLPIPSTKTTVMLSIDISRSMLATDMRPNRIEAAKTAAKEFVRVLPRGLPVGLVTFSSYATLVVPPTTDHDRVIEAIEGLFTEFATAVGDGLLEAVWAMPGRNRPDDPLTPPSPPQGDVPPGVVVLLSDGQSNRGIPPRDAAQIAREQKVKVYTVGIGRPEGTLLDLGGRAIWVRLDEETLKEIAEITEGKYFHVSSARELREVYRQLGWVVGWERKPTEVSALAGGVALTLLLGALLLSRAWIHQIH